MLKQAISTSRNINVKLATNLYDKQIEPIISYGCVNWALPASTLYAYLENIPSTVDISRIKDYLLCNNITISMCKRVGRCNNPTRPILLQFHNFENKLNFLTCNLYNLHPNAISTNYNVKLDTLNYEKTHNMYCKFALGVNRYSSNHACRADLGRFQVSFKLWTLCIKYWLRLESGNCNNILTNAYKSVKEEGHTWLENIKYLLFTNGYGNIWENAKLHSSRDELIERTSYMFNKRLKDEYIQYFNAKCRESDIYNHISKFIDSYDYKPYLCNVTNPVIRSIICKLRVGNNKLNFYTGTKFNSSKLCSGCDLNTEERVKHIILYCSKYSNYRNSFVNSLSSDIPWYSFDENKKLNFILNVNEQHVTQICNFINQIQKDRQM